MTPEDPMPITDAEPQKVNRVRIELLPQPATEAESHAASSA